MWGSMSPPKPRGTSREPDLPKPAKTGQDHYSHTLHITGTVRAFHEEARAARLTSPAAEATGSSSVKARFESGVSL